MKSQVSNTYNLRDSFFDNTLDGLAYCQVIFDQYENPIDFIYLEVNKNFEKLTGLKNVVGKRVTEVIPGVENSNQELFDIYGRVALTGKQEKFETYIKPLSKWFLVSVYSPKKKFFVAVFQNITDRKITEKNLENANIAARNVLEDLSIEKLKVEMAQAKEEAILFAIGDGVLVVDEWGNILIINKVAENLLGKKSIDVVGKLISDIVSIKDEEGNLIPKEARPITQALSSNIITNTTASGVTYYYVRKDKTVFPVAISVASVIFEGKVIGAIEVFRDITREKEIDKAKNEFISLASHQLRTPLTTVSWYAEMILRGDVGKVVPSQRKYLEEVYKGNERMILLVNTLLNVSHIELGTFKAELKPTDIIVLANSVLNELKPKIESKKLIIVEHFDLKIPILSTDPRLLRMVFQNILSNAAEYTKENGKIEFSLSLDKKNNIYMKVKDTGCGIPQNQQKQIFTKLFRADNVRDKETNGTGLGLYIAKSVIDNLGGKIWFESEENMGTTFYVTFPLIISDNKEISH